MYQLQSIIMPNISYEMHKEGLETYNDSIKYLFYFFLHLLDSIRILKLQLLDYNYMYIHNNLHDQLSYNFHYSLQLY